MKVKCNNSVRCGHYRCTWNCAGFCNHDIIALDSSGKCILEKPNNCAVEKAKAIAEAQNSGLPINTNAC